jgi:hypothetical protein
MGSIYRVFIEVAVVGHDFKWVLGVVMHIRKRKRKSTTTFGQKPPSNLGLSASNLDGTSSWGLSSNGKAYLVHQSGQLMVSNIDWNGELELDATFSPYISCAKVFPVRRDSPAGLGQDVHQCLS